MKKVLFLVLSNFLMCSFLIATPSSPEYVLVNKDEANVNQKFYGFQLENGVNWYAIQLTSSTASYVKGTSTTTYSSWWAIHTDTTTVKYRDAFTYQKYNYPN